MGRMIRLVESDRNIGQLHVVWNSQSSCVNFPESYLFHPLRFPACKNDQHPVFSGKTFAVQFWTAFFLFPLILLCPGLCILRCSFDQPALPSSVFGENHLSFSISSGVER